MASDDPADGSDEETPLEQVATGVVVGLTFLVGFGLLAVGHPWFWIAFPVGFAGALPAAIGIVRLYQSRTRTERDPETDALESLRTRYVRGEIDEAEFEERLSLLLDTESVSEARAFAARRQGKREREAAGRADEAMER